MNRTNKHKSYIPRYSDATKLFESLGKIEQRKSKYQPGDDCLLSKGCALKAIEG